MKNYTKGATIVTEGEVGFELFIIKLGSAHILKGGQVIGTKFENEFFGENALLLYECRAATVVAAARNT